jgi:PAS domain S-box-containing protein
VVTAAHKGGDGGPARSGRSVVWDHDAIHCGVLVVDADGVITQVNRPMAEMIGAPADAVLGLRIDESGDWMGRFFFEDGSPIAEEDLPIMRALRSGQPITDLVIGVLPEGSSEPRWVLLSVTPLHGDDATVVGLVATVTEITAQKRAETLLASTAAELHGVIHALPDLYFHLDAEGLVVDYHIGQGFDVHVGPEALIGRRPAEFLPPEIRGGARKAYAEARLSGNIVVFEAASEIDGEVVHHEFRFVALPGGEMVVIIRDITTQRRAEAALSASEERYRTMFERSKAGVFLYDTDLIVTECNEAFTRHTGMPREYFDDLDLLSLHDQRIVPALRRALDGEFGSYAGDYSPTVGGHGGSIVLSTQPLYGEHEEVTGGMAILVSMTGPDGAVVGWPVSRGPES